MPKPSVRIPPPTTTITRDDYAAYFGAWRVKTCDGYDVRGYFDESPARDHAGRIGGHVTYTGPGPRKPWIPPLIVPMEPPMPLNPYDQLTLIPTLVIETVLDEPYTGYEAGQMRRGETQIAETESRRKAMTLADRQVFIYLADQRCRAGYACKAAYFMKCLRGDNGPRQLSIWISHWLSAYLHDPDAFCRQCVGKSFAEIAHTLTAKQGFTLTGASHEDRA